MAISKAYLLAAACSLIILATSISSTESASCCLSYTKRPLPCTRLLGYTIQTINTSCDISAIIFHIPGRFVCANPNMKWTQRGMTCVNERRRGMADLAKQNTNGTASA